MPSTTLPATLSGAVTAQLNGEIAVTDTVAVDSPERFAKLTVLSVSSLLAQTIQNVAGDASVSAIFGGENELF